MIVDYIKHSHNKFIEESRKSNITEQWIYDTSSREGITYIIAEIGRDNEHRFVPDVWVYIDSSERKLYEYDIVNDSLLK